MGSNKLCSNKSKHAAMSARFATAALLLACSSDSDGEAASATVAELHPTTQVRRQAASDAAVTLHQTTHSATNLDQPAHQRLDRSRSPVALANSSDVESQLATSPPAILARSQSEPAIFASGLSRCPIHNEMICWNVCRQCEAAAEKRNAQGVLAAVKPAETSASSAVANKQDLPQIPANLDHIRVNYIVTEKIPELPKHDGRMLDSPTLHSMTHPALRKWAFQKELPMEAFNSTTTTFDNRSDSPGRTLDEGCNESVSCDALKFRCSLVCDFAWLHRIVAKLLAHYRFGYIGITGYPLRRWVGDGDMEGHQHHTFPDGAKWQKMWVLLFQARGVGFAENKCIERARASEWRDRLVNVADGGEHFGRHSPGFLYNVPSPTFLIELKLESIHSQLVACLLITYLFFFPDPRS